jgi:hypothetical protein
MLGLNPLTISGIKCFRMRSVIDIYMWYFGFLFLPDFADFHRYIVLSTEFKLSLNPYRMTGIVNIANSN